MASAVEEAIKRAICDAEPIGATVVESKLMPVSGR
jgi:hypothetical protein